VKFKAFDVPTTVVTVTVMTDGDPARTGTVTEQLVWSEHLIEAIRPPKRAMISPSPLGKLAPEITTD
jgi:hypothetical protein